MNRNLIRWRVALIFAHNQQAKTDLDDPSVLFLERHNVVRFSVGRTF